MNKKDIRDLIKVAKSNIDSDYRTKVELLAQSKFENWEIFNRASKILIYHSLPDEFPTLRLIESWDKRKEIFLPRVKGDDLEIIKYGTLHKGAFNIMEPNSDNTIDISEIDLIIIPAIALDKKGHRIGRGKGYYDRLLSNKCSATKVGLIYDFQLFEEIPYEEHDINLDYIITEKNHIFTK